MFDKKKIKGDVVFYKNITHDYISCTLLETDKPLTSKSCSAYSDSVELYRMPVEFELPEENVQKEIDVLEEQIKQKTRDFDFSIMLIKEKIQSLRAIEHKP